MFEKERDPLVLVTEDVARENGWLGNVITALDGVEEGDVPKLFAAVTVNV